MDQGKKSWTLGEIAEELGGELRGDKNRLVSRPAPAESDDPNGIAFAENEKFLGRAEASRVGCLLVPPGLEPKGKEFIIVEKPRLAFGRLLQIWQRQLPLSAGVHALAVVSPEAEIGEGASIGPFAVVERGARIGARTRVFPFAYIGEDCEVGEDSTVFPHAVLYQDVKLGPRAIVHAGAVLGADGFGFDWNGREQVKVPQIGNIEAGTDVEIGANTCVDRATAGTTRLGDDVKLDNLVQIGHNVSIGSHTVIAGQSGVSGSAEIGERVTIGGNAGITHHVRIASGVALGGRAGVGSDIDEPGEYWGTPARPIREAMRATLAIPKLPDLIRRVREIEKRLEELEKP